MHLLCLFLLVQFKQLPHFSAVQNLQSGKLHTFFLGTLNFEEDLVLDLRLKILQEKVDKFVIAEATKDHTGKDKKLNFNINNFIKFKDKISYVVVEDLPINIKSYKKNWK